jgi:phosphoglycolate phosphatase
LSRLVVLDVDGTFLDSLGFFARMLKEYSKDMGLPHPCIDTIKLGYGDPHNHDFKWGVGRDEQLRHLHAVWALCDEKALREPAPDLFAGVRGTLARLKDEGRTLAIVTSKPEVQLRHALEGHGLGKMFSAVRALDDVEKRGEFEKPAPDMLLSVMRELGFAAEETAMVGDTTMDMRMARAAKTRAIGVAWGAHPKALLVEAGAHRVVDAGFHEVAMAIGEA